MTPGERRVTDERWKRLLPLLWHQERIAQGEMWSLYYDCGAAMCVVTVAEYVLLLTGPGPRRPARPPLPRPVPLLVSIPTDGGLR